jgi:hypothetical protein
MNKGNCETKTQLLAAYQQATDLYSKAVAELARNVGKMSRIEYEKLNLASEKARLMATEARSNLDTHMYEHGC